MRREGSHSVAMVHGEGAAVGTVARERSPSDVERQRCHVSRGKTCPLVLWE